MHIKKTKRVFKIIEHITTSSISYYTIKIKKFIFWFPLKEYITTYSNDSAKVDVIKTTKKFGSIIDAKCYIEQTYLNRYNRSKVVTTLQYEVS